METARVRSTTSGGSSGHKFKDSKLSSYQGPGEARGVGHSRLHGGGSDAPLSLYQGRLLLRELSRSIKLSFLCCTPCFKACASSSSSRSPGWTATTTSFTLSGIGREHAAKRFLISHYIGPGPGVGCRHTTRPSAARTPGSPIDRAAPEDRAGGPGGDRPVPGRAGAGASSRRNRFSSTVRPGTAKPASSAGSPGLHQDTIVIPHAVEVDGQVIVLFDPAVHETGRTSRSSGLDPRWVVCRRPCVIVGGELEPSMLELQLEESTQASTPPRSRCAPTTGCW
ncbi:MAG: hypothetical protein MZU91_07170 [Desulfosudis oleivorans]|nr:hypothetical protein [Desulfosudis oleivorans]